MKIGQINSYKVIRETNLGYMLEREGEEFFLHHNECEGKHLDINEMVDAFLYVDKKGRIAATLFKPLCTLTKCGFCQVVGKTSSGVFVNIGLSKDILLSKDFLPKEEEYWPEEGDYIYCNLKIRQDKLLINPCNKDVILQNKTQDLEENSSYEGYVYRVSQNGINIVTTSVNPCFVYFANLRKKYRIGEKVVVKITHKGENDYSGTLIDAKEKVMASDAERIMEYLNNHGGCMMVTEDSDKEVIYKLFKMSKSAFKRAIGKLYKDKKILILDDKIIKE